ncbi:hypothetical protein PAXRUDRAFT_165482 [Paxillus rubicundulus Ve08.2h10]|uniref:Uncharacterized protein n=1 Tax=Paxillus rubicundulus Ve08.2h10 TaxID=930991 RepID=A0A0D0D2Y6_9AGAM|nr:hypothetical protein PAXRUDRAFT_165482 [Paxillus rubicundulus Ve08.2h10]
MDNAGNCNTTASELKKLIPTFGGSAARTRCFPHIINLIAKVHISISYPLGLADEKSRLIK